jgi:dihydroorotase
VVATFFKGHPTVLDGKLNTPYRWLPEAPGTPDGAAAGRA